MAKFGLALKEAENKIPCKTISVDEVQLTSVKASAPTVRGVTCICRVYCGRAAVSAVRVSVCSKPCKPSQ